MTRKLIATVVMVFGLIAASALPASAAESKGAKAKSTTTKTTSGAGKSTTTTAEETQLKAAMSHREDIQSKQQFEL